MNQKFKIIIIDDEPLARSIVRKYLTDYPSFYVVAECSNGFEGIKAIEEYQPDLVFLDIQMPKINGFEMLELIDEQPGVIFTTAFDEYAIRAFDSSAVDYLLKPFSKERFQKAIEKWKGVSGVEVNSKVNELIGKQPDEHLRIVVKEKENIQIVPTANVFFIEAYDDYVKIHTSEKSYLKKKTMNYYEQTLRKLGFIRIHRSFLLNINYLTRIESFEKNSYKAILTNGERLSISRNSYGDLKKLLGL